MEISQLISDVRSKTNNFQNVYYIPGRNWPQTIGKGTGTVLDPTYEHIRNVQKLDCSECAILKLFMKASACPYHDELEKVLFATLFETKSLCFG